MRPESTWEAPGPQTPDTPCSFLTHLSSWHGVPGDLPLLPGRAFWPPLGFGEGRRKGSQGRKRKKEGKKEKRKEEGIRFNPFRSAIVNINQLLLLLVPRWNVSLKRGKIKKEKKYPVRRVGLNAGEQDTYMACCAPPLVGLLTQLADGSDHLEFVTPTPNTSKACHIGDQSKPGYQFSWYLLEKSVVQLREGLINFASCW